jgi:purine-binding chemotaxis protein CheW
MQTMEQKTQRDTIPESSNLTDSRAGKYLAFYLGNEQFGLQVLTVREIIGAQDITAVPKTPNYLKGVINLRGKVIPIVDLRIKFGLEEIAYTKRTCIIVVQVDGENGGTLIGVVVDGVSEVLNILPQDLENTPNFGTGEAIPYILGMAKMKDGVKMLLDIGSVLSQREFQGLGALVG